MIYDCTIYFNEIEMLEFRLRHLYDVVDKLVIAEANQTFSGREKHLQLSTWPDHLSGYRDKIIYIPVTNMPNTPNPWIRECFQRNSIIQGLSKAKDNDLVLISDIDEIPKIAPIEKNISNDDICSLKQKFYYYFFNLRKGDWNRSTATLYKNLCITPHESRNLRDRKIIENAGWHFSYLMSPDDISKKIQAFSHQEFNLPRYTNIESIKEAIKLKKDIFGRNDKILTVENITNDFPDELIKNIDKYKAHII